VVQSQGDAHLCNTLSFTIIHLVKRQIGIQCGNLGLAVCTPFRLGRGYSCEEVWEYECACNGCSVGINLGGTSCPEWEHPVLKGDIPSWKGMSCHERVRPFIERGNILMKDS